MSELEEIEWRLTDALTAIRKHWPAILTPSAGTSASAPSTDEVTALDRRISLCHEVTLCLNGWARVIVEDRELSHHLPLGHDTIGLVDLIERHARWFSGHEAAPDAADELSEWSDEIRRTAQPKRSDFVYLGDCPFVVEDWFCSGRVRVRIGGEGNAACSDCGQETVTEWWEEVLGVGLPAAPISGPRLAQLAYERLHVRITDRTILNWLRDGRITKVEMFGPQTLHPRYDPAIALDQIARMGRQCPMCGRVWEGVGEVCRPCQASLLTAKPVHAARKAHTPAPTPLRPRRIVPDSDDTDRPDRCHHSDLPIQWCACGHHERAAV